MASIRPSASILHLKIQVVTVYFVNPTNNSAHRVVKEICLNHPCDALSQPSDGMIAAVVTKRLSRLILPCRPTLTTSITLPENIPVKLDRPAGIGLPAL